MKPSHAYRWMLLLFKREFPWEEGLRCFEIISSHYLEVSSIEAEKIRYEEHRLGFQNIGTSVYSLLAAIFACL